MIVAHGNEEEKGQSLGGGFKVGEDVRLLKPNYDQSKASQEKLNIAKTHSAFDQAEQKLNQDSWCQQ